MDSQQIQQAIAKGFKKLRKEKRISQADLARLLNISQPQLSKVENAQSSLTAEQFVSILQAYSLPLHYFISDPISNPAVENAELQNGLIHLGATHLRRVPDVIVPERLSLPETAIVEVLLAPAARLVTALAPVIVRNHEKINFYRISEVLKQYGFERRIWWLVDCVYSALQIRLQEPYLPREIFRIYQKAFLLLERKKLDVYQVRAQFRETPDEFDSDLISQKTVQLVIENRDTFADLWSIVTRIRVEDFTQALADTESA